MSEFFKAELKDKFLAYALERDDYFQIEMLYDKFLKPKYSKEYVQKLIFEIVDHDPNLLDIMSGNGMKIFMVSATAYTQKFLEEEGFKKNHITEEEKWDSFLNQLSNSRKAKKKNKMGATTEKGGRQKEYVLVAFLIVAIVVSFVFTLTSLVDIFFFKNSTVKQRELQTELETLRSEMQHSNDSLVKRIETMEALLRSKDSLSQ